MLNDEKNVKKPGAIGLASISSLDARAARDPMKPMIRAA